MALGSRREGKGREGKERIERGEKIRRLMRSALRRGEVESLAHYRVVGSMWVVKLVSCNTHVKSGCALLLGQTRKKAAGAVLVTITSCWSLVWIVSMQGKSDSCVAYLQSGNFHPVGFSAWPWLVAPFTSKSTLISCCRSSPALRSMSCRSPTSLCATSCSEMQDARS